MKIRQKLHSTEKKVQCSLDGAPPKWKGGSGEVLTPRILSARSDTAFGIHRDFFKREGLSVIQRLNTFLGK